MTEETTTMSLTPSTTTRTVLERLFANRVSFGHILQEIFLNLDSRTLKNLRLCNQDLRQFTDRILWRNSRGKNRLFHKLTRNWKERNSEAISESAFQCSDEVFDIKIRGDSIICGLRNGTIELWDKETLKKTHSLLDQNGSVQVDADERFVVGISSDSTVCFWSRATGQFIDVLYHHRASVWGLRIVDNFAITGSMDGTISLIELSNRQVRKHFLAHADTEWGVSDIDADKRVIASGCLDHQIKLWSFPECRPLLTINTDHTVNCVSISPVDEIVASSSRTGSPRENGNNIHSKVSNVILWCMKTGEALKRFDLPSCCFVSLDAYKLVCLTAAGDAIIGEHHVVKWPIAKIVILPIRSQWPNTAEKSEILLRYRRTPAVFCTETCLIYSLDRTPGMCNLIDFWPN